MTDRPPDIVRHWRRTVSRIVFLPPLSLLLPVIGRRSGQLRVHDDLFGYRALSLFLSWLFIACVSGTVLSLLGISVDRRDCIAWLALAVNLLPLVSILSLWHGSHG